RELAPVIGGQGRPDDHADRGWGIVLDTVEIQEVKVLSRSVFDAMQAPYRAALERRAREAQIESNAAISTREAELARDQLERSHRDRVAARELELREEEARVADAIRRQELVVEEAQKQIEAHAIKAKAKALAAELESLEWHGALERYKAESEVQASVDQRQAEVALAAAAAEARSAEAKARVITAERLPELAAAVGERFGEVKVTQIGGGPDSNPFASVAQAVSAVLELAKS
ncbi:MAG: hypothetical protein KC636_00215, partial [Myxococcales bacterium]|nr:hypothetical protein [Myxococcales bacterium]